MNEGRAPFHQALLDELEQLAEFGQIVVFTHRVHVERASVPDAIRQLAFQGHFADRDNAFEIGRFAPLPITRSAQAPKLLRFRNCEYSRQGAR